MSARAGEAVAVKADSANESITACAAGRRQTIAKFMRETRFNQTRLGVSLSLETGR
jgi:hypothetical protein